MAVSKLEYLEAQYLATGLIGRILTADISEQLLSELVSEQLFVDDPPLYDVNESCKTGLDLLRSWTKRFSTESCKETYSDYMRLLIGTGLPLAPPWESVYRHEEAVLFQEETADVRAWYRRFGKEIANRGKEPEDHIGYELEFVSLLSEKMLDALKAGDEEKLQELMQARTEFLKNHLSIWGFTWCEKTLAASRGEFYKGIALYVRGILEHLSD